MKKIGVFLFLLTFLLFGCAKKEAPPIGMVPFSSMEKGNETIEVKKIENATSGEFGKVEEMETSPEEEVFKPEEITSEHTNSKKKNREYLKLYGRSSPPLLAIFFDFDKYTIRDDMWDRIKKNVKYLLEHKDVKIELQGNCDERGTNEYNMALGAKRAQEVKKILVKLGIDEHRIRTISFGEERPICNESNEECWQLNRRVDFVIIK